jgi:hypothetical protein
MKHKISIKPYEYDCGDGCRSEYGHEFFVDGESVYKGPDEDSGWLAVMRRLGNDVGLVGLDEDGEETWEM